jgi:hypothetical protein
MIGSEAVISILGFTMIGVAGLLRLLPVGTCSECPHCRLARFERERERGVDGARSMTASFCAVCGRHHRPDEDHQF